MTTSISPTRDRTTIDNAGLTRSLSATFDRADPLQIVQTFGRIRDSVTSALRCRILSGETDAGRACSSAGRRYRWGLPRRRENTDQPHPHEMTRGTRDLRSTRIRRSKAIRGGPSTDAANSRRATASALDPVDRRAGDEGHRRRWVLQRHQHDPAPRLEASRHCHR